MSKCDLQLLWSVLRLKINIIYYLHTNGGVNSAEPWKSDFFIIFPKLDGATSACANPRHFFIFFNCFTFLGDSLPTVWVKKLATLCVTQCRCLRHSGSQKGLKTGFEGWCGDWGKGRGLLGCKKPALWPLFLVTAPLATVLCYTQCCKFFDSHSNYKAHCINRR